MKDLVLKSRTKEGLLENNRAHDKLTQNGLWMVRHFAVSGPTIKLEEEDKKTD